MTEPYLTIHKQNILKFVNKAARGITDDTLRLLTNDSSKDCNAKEIIHLLTEQNGSYPFEINGEKYLRYTAFGNMMYIFKFGKQKDDNSKYLFIRMNDSLNNCIYMIDKTAIFSIMITKYAIYVKKPEYPFNIPKIELGNGYYAVIFRCENGSKLIQVLLSLAS